jgi:hypothetical protein
MLGGEIRCREIRLLVTCLAKWRPSKIDRMIDRLYNPFISLLDLAIAYQAFGRAGHLLSGDTANRKKAE